MSTSADDGIIDVRTIRFNASNRRLFGEHNFSGENGLIRLGGQVIDREGAADDHVLGPT